MSRTRAFRIGLFCALGVLLAGVTTTRGQDEIIDPTALRSYLSGNGFLNRGLYDLAATEYRKFLSAYPGHEKAPTARYGLGVSLYRLGRYGEAVDELTTLRAGPDVPFPAEVSVVMGQCRLALGEPERAVDLFNEVLDTQPNHDLADEAVALKAESLHLAGRHDEVEDTVAILVERWPDSPFRERAELFAGLAGMSRGEFAASADRFEQMTTSFPDGAHAEQTALLLAQCWHRAETYDRAETQYRAVLERRNERTRPDALFGLATLLHQRGALEDSADVADDLLGLDVDPALQASTRLLRGRVAYELGDYPLAMEQLERSSLIDGEHLDDATWWMAKCELRQDQPRRAADRLAAGLERYPDGELAAEMCYDLGVTLLRADAPDDAVTVLETFRSRYPDHPLAADALNVLAITDHQEGRYDRSLERCREFIDRHPDHATASAVLFLAAENLFLDTSYGESARVYEEYLERHGDGDQADKARYRLGMAQYHIQAFDDALPMLGLVSDGPQTPAAFRSSLLALGDIHFQREQWADAESRLAEYLAFGSDMPAADDALLKFALALQRQERYEDALQAHTRLLSEYRGSPHVLQAMFEAAQSLVALDRPDEAKRVFIQVIDRGAGSRFEVHALNHLGAISMQQGEYDDAADYFARTVERAEEGILRGDAVYQQGQALMAAGRFGPAAESFGRLLRDVPDHARGPEAAALQAMATARDDQHAEALTLIAGVVAAHADDLAPDLMVAVLYEEAWCHRALDHDDAAIATYRRLLEHDGGADLKPHAMLELAELESEAERYEPAGMLLRELRALADSRSVDATLLEQAAYRLGVCEFRLERHESAAELFESFLREHPSSDFVPSASLLCSESLFETGEHRRAIAHATRVIEEHDDDEALGPCLLRAGECRAVLQEWFEGEAAFREYLDRFPEAPQWYQARFGLGWARENQNRFDEAVADYRIVVDRHQGPTAARAQFQIGECLFAEKRYEQAVSELLKVDILYAYPEWSAAALFEAGRCFEEMANPVEARRQFEQLVSEHEGTHWAELASVRLEALAEPSLPGH